MPETQPGRFRCTSCDRSYRWKPELAGKKVRCQCGTVLVAPQSVAPVAEVRQAPETFELADSGPGAATPEPPRPKPAKAAVPARAPVAAKSAAAAKPAPKAKSAPAPASASASGTPPQATCPECEAAVSPTAVICVQCGYNLKSGTKLTTAADGAARGVSETTGTPRTVHNAGRLGLVARLAQSWQLAKISYGVLWDFKKLILFPVLSAVACIAIVLSFLIPIFLWFFRGFMVHGAPISHATTAPAATSAQSTSHAVFYLLAFGFYFCTYFVMVFFGTALTACVMKVANGEPPALVYGLSIVFKRLPQVLAWAFVSAIVGVVLKAIETANKKVGKIIAAVLGTGWAVATYFVVPVLCVEGVGPVQAVKSSFSTLKATWGDDILANFAMGIMNFLMVLAIFAFMAIGTRLAALVGSTRLAMGVGLAGVVLLVAQAAAASAANGILKALLYNFATGRSLPAGVEEDALASAFGSK